MRLNLRKRIFLNFVLVIALFGIAGAMLGAMLINRSTLDEAQRRVRLDLRSAWSVIQGEQDILQLFVRVLGGGKRVRDAFLAPDAVIHRSALEAARRQSGFDFVTLTDNAGRVILRTREPYTKGDYLANDPLVAKALRGEVASAFAIFSAQRLRTEGGDLEERAFAVFEYTPKAKPRAKTFETAGMVLMAAAPLKDQNGRILGAIYAGILLNRNYTLVDKIRSIVFENETYDGQNIGTVTIFQWDTRIATNVVRTNGNRALFTRVSQDVYDKVLENGQPWYDRAFVVCDWYLSAYDPIFDAEQKVVGILYVGVLAKQYDDLKHELWRIYGYIALGAAAIVLVLGAVFTKRLTGSVTRLADAAVKIAGGNLDMAVPEPSTTDEIRDLTHAFNDMAESLRNREERLKAVNTSLKHLNAEYLDMLGFVSHELKNTLGVIYTSARALDIGLVGTLTKNQAELVRNISKSISSAVTMTRNYLDLARIEQGQLTVKKGPVNLVQEVVTPVLDDLKPLAGSKHISFACELPESLVVSGDAGLLQIVYKNLLDNALKYGRPDSTVRLGGQSHDGAFWRLEVFNQGSGLEPEKIKTVFDKFVRYAHASHTSRTTGLGLFITKDIIEKHGGRIWAESVPGEWIKFSLTLPKTA